MALITITTDLGDQFATAQLRAVIHRLGYDGQIIENHGVTPFSIVEGAFQVKTVAHFCPQGTIHFGLVDPGVGSDRSGIIIQTKNSFFIGPDNGLLWPATQKEQIKIIWEINGGHFGKISNTFHGRDYFIKTAVLLAQGHKPESFGCSKIRTVQKLKFIDGQVLHIDNYGNVKIYSETLALQGDALQIQDLKIPFVKTFSDVPPGKPLAYWGSSNTLELAINLGNAAKEFNIKQGDILEIT